MDQHGQGKRSINDQKKPEGNNHLLAIKIDEYQIVTKLNNRASNVSDLTTILTKKYRFNPENVKTLFDEQATRTNILIALESYINHLAAGGCLFIWLTRHGETLQDKGHYVPVEAKMGIFHNLQPG